MNDLLHIGFADPLVLAGKVLAQKSGDELVFERIEGQEVLVGGSGRNAQEVGAFRSLQIILRVQSAADQPFIEVVEGELDIIGHPAFQGHQEAMQGRVGSRPELIELQIMQDGLGLPVLLFEDEEQVARVVDQKIAVIAL